WVDKVIRNVFHMENILRTFESLPRVFLQALLTGLWTVFSVTVLLLLSRESYRDVGFRKQDLLRQLRNGCLFGLLIFILDTIVLSPILEAVLPPTSAQGIDMARLFDQAFFLPVFIFIALFKGGFSEELWRVFILTRFEKALGRPGLVLALVLSSAAFGVGHLYQGVSGMISIGLIGFLYALVYLRKRLMLEAVFAHAAFNLIQIVLGYIVYSGKS
ncbi:MAG: CPBP family intramembrane metalloprotease, partial [Candidatus Aminicenantes bacterium]|nr:CPBP family intramembrane metalloprotease [Candidatus Aminicenantes bacterium]